LGVALTFTSGCAGVLSSTTAVPQASIQFTPSTLNFGSVSVGQKVSQALSIKNTGTAALSVTAANVTNTQFTFSGVTLPFSLVAGSTANLTVSFTGSASGGVNGMLTLQTNAGNFSAAMTATATPAGPQLSPSTNSVSFG